MKPRNLDDLQQSVIDELDHITFEIIQNAINDFVRSGRLASGKKPVFRVKETEKEELSK